ncbi:hypothetical protein [Streptosporangium carneum]|uniref:Uncharacterized protein n=1 Tax=Streptosporangium carneum TaxID=47481 RepID=A0A9W6HZL3_9ACTN|nr:hypothetical protein [Streptosporangium carneum]GLK09287.1 hypothetical protein GCM10017600_26930 [Streptosporangium carneum]
MLKDSADLRRVGSGLLLIIAPLPDVVATALPSVAYGEGGAVTQTASVLYQAGDLLTALAIIGLLHTMGSAGVFWRVAGWLTAAANVVASVLPLVADTGLYKAPGESRLPLDYAFVLSMFLAGTGLLLVLIGVWRAGFGHGALPLLIVAGWVLPIAVPLLIVTSPAAPLWLPPMLTALALAWLGVKILRTSREKWDSY